MRVDVALVTTHVAPAVGYGGVCESAARLARVWDRDGRRFRLVSSDASSGNPPLRPDDVGLAAPVTLYRARLWKRWGFGLGAPAAIARVCWSAESVYIAGIATWPTTLAAMLCALLGRRFVVAPRGGMMPAHIAVIRRSKPHKWLFYQLLTLPTMRAAAQLHATSPLEADGIRRLIPDRPIVVLGNGVDLEAWPALPAPPPRDGLTLAYAGRLASEKGIAGFLEIWRGLRRPGDRFLIAGDGSGAYARRVRDIAASCGDAVQLFGYLDADGVRRMYADADFVVMPSGLEDGDIRENFGNAAAEALCCGRPILVTRGLVWDHAEAAGAALTFPPTVEGASRAIATAGALPYEQKTAMGVAARRLAEDTLGIDAVADRLWAVVTGSGDQGAEAAARTDGPRPG